jgi:hypothetical protein
MNRRSNRHSRCKNVVATVNQMSKPKSVRNSWPSHCCPALPSTAQLGPRADPDSYRRACRCRRTPCRARGRTSRRCCRPRRRCVCRWRRASRRTSPASPCRAWRPPARGHRRARARGRPPRAAGEARAPLLLLRRRGPSDRAGAAARERGVRCGRGGRAGGARFAGGASGSSGDFSFISRRGRGVSRRDRERREGSVGAVESSSEYPPSGRASTRARGGGRRGNWEGRGVRETGRPPDPGGYAARGVVRARLP